MDGASGNVRLVHWEKLQDEPNLRTFTIDKNCTLHEVNLCLGSVCVSKFVKLSENLFNAAGFFGMGGYWLRMLVQVKPLSECMVEYATDVEPFWEDATNGLISLLGLTHKQGLCFRGKGFKPTYLDDLRYLFRGVFNVSLSKELPMAWRHKCRDPSCCPHLGFTQRRFQQVVLRTVLRRRPGKPAHSRWTLVAPSVDFFILASVTNVLRPLIEYACRQIKKVDGEAGCASEYLPEDFVRDFCWDAVVSKRADRVLAMVRQPDFVTKVLIYGVVLAGYRYVTTWLFQHTKASQCDMPALVNWLGDTHSPYRKAMQYFRTTLVNKSSCRYIAVWAVAGYKDRESFVRSHCYEVRQLHDSMLTAGAWLFLRNVTIFREPFVLARRCDTRLPTSTHEQESAEFYNKPECQLDWGCSKKLRKRLPNAQALMSDARNIALCEGISNAPLHDGAIECLHARGQQHIHENSSWATFAQDFVVSSAQAASSSLDAYRSHLRKCLTPPPTSPDIDADMGASDAAGAEVKGMHGLAVFMQRQIRARQVAGDAIPNVSDPDFWEQCRIRFNSDE